ncbi:hypothetical protein Nepgr_026894 [Nepenthes gracilis]|uniref:Rotamase n=1 Tax=Nepenthes gracilis TaxID=150966 RepID=A0AAD3Y2Z4_NEPGR|nr:hypothetical protein Nepgr_026894 [Nepenthes gracilis]
MTDVCKDGGIYKTISKLQDGTVFVRKGHGDEDKLFDFTVEEEPVIVGLDIAVQTMKKGEVSLLTIVRDSKIKCLTLYFERSRVQSPPRSLDSTPNLSPPVTHPSNSPGHASVGMPFNALRRLDEAMASKVESLHISRIESLSSMMNLLVDMLQAITPTNRMAVEDQVLVDLVDLCHVNQTKLLQLRDTATDDRLLALGFELNDALQRALAKPNANRFVLSTSHGCMLQYALLHLTSCDSVQEEDLKSFCQWESRTLGQPAHFETPGMEVLTGSLGQGIANVVSLVLAERHLAARFYKPDLEIVDHYTYIIMGDGCQLDGVSNEARFLTGHWRLGKPIAFYGDNHISINGDTKIAFTKDVTKRFKALGWLEICAATKKVAAVKDRPSLTMPPITIGFGSPTTLDSHNVPESAFGVKEVNMISCFSKLPPPSRQTPVSLDTANHQLPPQHQFPSQPQPLQL